jgi:hypothetical protein
MWLREMPQRCHIGLQGLDEKDDLVRYLDNEISDT